MWVKYFFCNAPYIHTEMKHQRNHFIVQIFSNTCTIVMLFNFVKKGKEESSFILNACEEQQNWFFPSTQDILIEMLAV